MYIPFTEEQKLRANSVDLEDFLVRRGERLIRSGPEKRLASNRSITVRGNTWFDHSPTEKTGGGAVSFVRYYYGLSYPEAVMLLLGGEQGAGYRAAKQRPAEPPKPFELPPANSHMRRVYAYLLNQRYLSREMLTVFVQEGLIYESRERSRDGLKEYHNAVFVGCDENGFPRHAHKKGVYSDGPSYRLNVAGSDPRCSFHRIGTSDQLYVFEAPIDLLSFITLHPDHWREHSYLALCGTGEQALFWMLEHYPHLRTVTPCLDHDEAGIEANGALDERLRGKGYFPTEPLQSEYKDWNEDVKASHGLPAQPAEKHPLLIVAPTICAKISRLSAGAPDGRFENRLPGLLEQYNAHLNRGRLDRAWDCMEQAAVLSSAAALRECRQGGVSLTEEDMAKKLQAGMPPHRNRGCLKSRGKELSAQLRNVLTQQNAKGIRTADDKKQLANVWFELAVGCTKALVKAEAEQIKLEQKNNQEMAMG